MRKVEALAVGRLLDEFGGDVLVEWQRAAELSTRERLEKRLKVDEALADLNLQGHIVVPPSWSPHRLPRDGRIAVIGPSPTFEDVKHSELGWSSGSRRLHRELRNCGVSNDMVCDLTAVFHWPQLGDKGQRPPTTRELTDARGLLLAALDAADVDHVLLHGGHAMSQWRRAGTSSKGQVSLRLEEAAGRQFIWGGRWWVTPIMHWSAVAHDVVTYERRWCEHVARFVETIYDPEPIITERLSDRCLAKGCGEGVDAWDQDGVPWCRKHVASGQGVHRRTVINPPTVQGGLVI